MFTPKRLARLVSICGVFVIASAQLCGTIKEGGGNPSTPPDTRPCDFTIGTSAADAAAGETFSQTEPRKCPAVLSGVGDSVPYFFTIDANRPPVTLGVAVDLKMKDNNLVQRYSDMSGYFSQYTPNSNNGKVRATLSGRFPSGYGTFPLRDVGQASFPVTGYGFAAVTIYIPTRILPNGGDVVLGSTNPMVSVSNTWRARPEGDTGSYLFQWKRDGVDLPGKTQALLTWMPAAGDLGDHSLTVEIRRANMIPYTRTLNVTVAGNCGGIPCP